jgi:hypothetical protein
MNQACSTRFRTEIDFTLPKGYLDPHGVLHRTGNMRLATAADEILPLRDPRVQQNPAYLAIIVLSRVIVKLGCVQDIDVKVVEGLFAVDFDYLQRLYERFNSGEEADTGTSGAGAEIDDAEPSAPMQRMRALGEA